MCPLSLFKFLPVVELRISDYAAFRAQDEYARTRATEDVRDVIPKAMKVIRLDLQRAPLHLARLAERMINFNTTDTNALSSWARCEYNKLEAGSTFPVDVLDSCSPFAFDAPVFDKAFAHVKFTQYSPKSPVMKPGEGIAEYQRRCQMSPV